MGAIILAAAAGREKRDKIEDGHLLFTPASFESRFLYSEKKLFIARHFSKAKKRGSFFKERPDCVYVPCDLGESLTWRSLQTKQRSRRHFSAKAAAKRRANIIIVRTPSPKELCSS